MQLKDTKKGVNYFFMCQRLCCSPVRLSPGQPPRTTPQEGQGPVGAALTRGEWSEL